MIYYKTREEIELLRKSSLLVSKTLAEVGARIEPGVTPKELDALAEEFILDHGAKPGFKGFNDYPFSLCTSVNEQVVHGMPTDKPLSSGDIISVDCGVLMNEFYGDHAYTFLVGEVSEPVKKLVDTTKECLLKGIEVCNEGQKLGDVGFAIQFHAERNGFSVVRELVGHGIGRSMHEAPEVPNYGKKGKGKPVREGLALAIEPMINMGTRAVRQLNDGWTIVTKDGKPSAHFEHNVAVIDGKAEVLSSFDIIEERLKEKV